MIEMHVCTTGMIEGAPPLPEEEQVEKPESLRSVLLGLWSVYQMATTWHKWIRKTKDLEVLLYYGIEVYTRSRRTPMDVPKMVDNWKDVFVTLCTAHDKDEIDKAEYKMDELLTPILSAPVAQLREFYVGLRDALKADVRVPFFVWSIFRAWGLVVAEKATDEPTRKHLRKQLATEIAEMVDDKVRGDLVEALVGALMWRDPPTLKKIKEDLNTGAKPRLRGRESCLFLVTERKKGRRVEELNRIML